MNYINMLELPQIEGRSEKQIEYAFNLRKRFIYENYGVFDYIACLQFYNHEEKIFNEIHNDYKWVLYEQNAYFIIKKALQLLDE